MLHDLAQLILSDFMTLIIYRNYEVPRYAVFSNFLLIRRSTAFNSATLEIWDSFASR
jgi:hypothetical protein